MATTDYPDDNTNSRQRFLAIVGAIVIGYVVAFADSFSEGTQPYTPFTLGAIVIIGVIYTYLLLKEETILGENATGQKKAVYFLVMLGLLGLTFSLVETINGIWLITMPLVGTGVAMLPRLRGWLLATAVFTIMLIPIALRYSIEEAVNVGISLAPAIIFVIIFVRLWINAEEARQRTQKLADQLETANRQLASYATQAEELATTRERNRLAREIHDSIGHYLTVINVQIEAARTIMAQNPGQADDALLKAQTLTQEGLASVRQSVATLRESPLQDRPLVDAITRLIEESRNAGLVTEITVKGSGRPLDPNAELTLFRAVQEGLTNVRKHARASRVDLALDYRNAELVSLTIEDNGVGADQTKNSGFGLLGVQERVKLLGGEMQIETGPNSGFKLMVAIPA